MPAEQAPGAAALAGGRQTGGEGMGARTATLLAALFAALAFLPTLGAGFVYDDHRFYADNDALTHLSVLWRAFADPAVQTADDTFAGLWRPLRTLSFALDRGLFGDAPFGPHLTSVLLHALCTGLLATLLRRLGARPAAMLLGALVYALHPVQVECVGWISSRGDLLAMAGVLAALIAVLSGRIAWSLVFGAAALLSKEQAIVWPALVPLVLLPAGRGRKATFRATAAAAAVVLAFLVVRGLLLAEPLQEGGLGGGPIRDTRLLGMLGHQAWFTLLPCGSLFDWQMARDASPPLAALSAGLAVLAAVFPRACRREALWFLAALVPTLFVQVLVPLNILVAERFLLFALPALSLLVARAVTSEPRVVPAAIVACFAFTALTEDTLPRWHDEASLWTPVAERVPGHWRANAWLGWRALELGNLDAAVRHLELAAGSGPSSGLTLFQLADALEKKAVRDRDPELMSEARRRYAEALFQFSLPRQEGRGALAPIARLAVVDTTLFLNEREAATAAIEALLSGPRPEMPEHARAPFRRRLERLAERVEQYLDPEREPGRRLAPRLRDWGEHP